MPLIVRLEEAGQSRGFRFPDTADRIVIGRGTECDIPLVDVKSSRTHCQIERTAGGWKLVDLESRNGTKVRGLVVNSHVLVPGDEIAIGEARIVFEGTPADARRPAPAPVPVGAPEIGGTVMMGRPAPAPEKRRRGIGGILAAGGVAAGLLIAGFAALEIKATADRRANEGHAWETAEAGETDAERATVGQSAAAWRRARDRYRDFARTYTASPRRDAAEAAAARLDARATTVGRWELQLAAVEQERKAFTPDAARLGDWRARLEALQRSSPSDQALTGVADAIGTLDAAVERFEADRVAAVERLVEADCAQGEFARAAGRLAALRTATPPLPDARLATVREREVAIGRAATDAFDREVGEPVDALLAAGKHDAARAALAAASPRYAGVGECDLKLAVKIHVVELVQKAGAPTAPTPEVFGSDEGLATAAVEAEEAMKAWRFADAVAAYERIAAGASVRSVKVEFGRKAEDCRRQQALVDRCRTDAVAGRLNDREWRLARPEGPPLMGKLAGATADGLTLKIGAGTVRKRWDALTPDEWLAFLSLPALLPDEEMAWACFAFQAGRKSDAEARLVALAQRDAGRGAEIRLLVSRLRREPEPTGGYVLHEGRFVSPLERDQALAAAAREAQIRAVRDATPDGLAAAVGALVASPGGAPHAVEALRARQTAVEARLADHVAPLAKPDPALVAARETLDEKRRHALAFIWDLQKYPDKKVTDPEVYRRAQDEVDLRVKAVREAWEAAPKSATAIHPKAATMQRELDAVVALRATLDASVKGAAPPGYDAAYLEGFAGERLTVQTFPVSRAEQAVLAYNHAVCARNAAAKGLPSDMERKQVEVTNAYRMMMGFGPQGGPGSPDRSQELLLRAVLIDDRLVQSAKWHSEYMASTGKFAHVIEGHPHGASPFERMANAGYKGNGSENIHKGSGDPTSAHLSWLHSAGHHRNILTAAWRALGVGNSSSLWTQNFGATPPPAPETAGTAKPARDRSTG